MKLIAIVLACLLTATIGWNLRGAFMRGKDFASFERGAHAVMMHHKTKGNYGSRAYREQAFAWGYPQNEQDINAILSLGDH